MPGEVMRVVEKRAIVQSQLGLHGRPSHRLVELVTKSRCKVVLQTGRREADGRSILQVIKINARQYAEVVIRATGPDAEEVVAGILEIVLEASDSSLAYDPGLVFPYEEIYRTATRFDSHITLSTPDFDVDATAARSSPKDRVGTLVANEKISIVAIGEDAGHAVDRMKQVLMEARK
jgi:phosphocarrier protein HPr